MIDFLLRKRITGLAYETLKVNGRLPLLEPMSEIAGRMSPLVGCYFLQKFLGGMGYLPTGTSGVKPGKIVILGAGVVGSNAVHVAIGLGMEAVVMAKTVEKLQRLGERYKDRLSARIATEETISEEISDAHIVIGAVLVPGERTPVLVRRDMLKLMKKGAVIVDVSVDQGGCFETTKPTTHSNPVYVEEGIIHYAVANMPGAYPRTATIALSNATLPFVKLIAELGVERAINEREDIKSAVNTCDSKCKIKQS